MCASRASRLWECWLPEERPAPNWVRTVRAISADPPVMNGSLAAWLSSWSKQTPRKSRYMTSTTGPHAGHGRTDGETDDRGLGDRRVPDPVAEARRGAHGSGRTRCRPRRRRHRRGRPARRRPARTRGRCGWRPWCGTSARRSGRRRRVRVSTGAVRTTKSKSVAATGWRTTRARSTAVSSSVATDDSSASISALADAGLEEPPPVEDERVTLLPLPHLLGRPVALRVALVVAVPAVGGRLDDGGTAPDLRRLDDVPHGRSPWPRRRCRPRRTYGSP